MGVKFNQYNTSFKCHTRSCYMAKNMRSFWVGDRIWRKFSNVC